MIYRAALALPLLLPGFSRAQSTTGATANPPAAAPALVQLSPFEVTSERENGYVASHTLAGTRLNSPVKDLGASITILTAPYSSREPCHSTTAPTRAIIRSQIARCVS